MIIEIMGLQAVAHSMTNYVKPETQITTHIIVATNKKKKKKKEETRLSTPTVRTIRSENLFAHLRYLSRTVKFHRINLSAPVQHPQVSMTQSAAQETLLSFFKDLGMKE